MSIPFRAAKASQRVGARGCGGAFARGRAVEGSGGPRRARERARRAPRRPLRRPRWPRPTPAETRGPRRGPGRPQWRGAGETCLRLRRGLRPACRSGKGRMRPCCRRRAPGGHRRSRRKGCKRVSEREREREAALVRRELNVAFFWRISCSGRVVFAPPFHRGQDPDKSNDIQMQKGAIKAQRCEKLDGTLKLSSGGSGERRRRRRPFNTLSSLSHFFSPYRALTASCSAVTRTALGAAGASVVIVSWVRGREKCVSKRASRLLNSFFVDAQQRKKSVDEGESWKKTRIHFLSIFSSSQRFVACPYPASAA